MDKEIKEILRYLEECVANDNRFLIGNTNATKLSYYITNLQEENCKLRETNEEHQKINGQLQEENKFLKDYKNAYGNVLIANKMLEKENIKLVKVIDEIEKELWKIRQLTFTKYNSNEWNNCLSFNDDILPIINKLTELKGGDNDEETIEK